MPHANTKDVKFPDRIIELTGESRVQMATDATSMTLFSMGIKDVLLSVSMKKVRKGADIASAESNVFQAAVELADIEHNVASEKT